MEQLIENRSNKRQFARALAMGLGFVCLLSWLFESKLQGLLVGLIDKHFDVYYPDLTGLTLTLIAIAVPFFLARHSPAISDQELSYAELVSRLKRRIVFLFLAVLSLSAITVTLHHMYTRIPAADQPLIEVDLNDDSFSFLFLERVSLNGVAVNQNATFSKDFRHQSSTMLRRYTPIVSKSGNTQPIRFVESFTSDSTEILNQRPVSMQGFVSPRVLPAAIRTAFEADGLQMANIVYVIETDYVDVKPILKWLWIAMSIITLAVLIRLLLSPNLHRAKLQTAWDYQRGYSKNKNVKDDIAPWS